MKLLVLLIAIMIYTSAFAQQKKFTGIWEGKIDVGITLRIAFHFTPDSSGNIVSTMDSPDQSVFGIPTDYTNTKNDSIFTGIKKFQVSFSGKIINDSTIQGEFRQTASVPLTLIKVTKITVAVKPQTPKPPFPYNSEDVSYRNGDNEIAATLTWPKTDPEMNYIKAPVYPAVILVSGSGPQNRDSEIMGHKLFAVIADEFTKKGFIVLRYDERGVGRSTGDFETATSLDFATDVIAGINYLKKRKETDTTRIGILGHSEGGMIAPIVAQNRNDIKFLVLMAAPGIKTIDLMAEQNIAILKSRGIRKKTAEDYGSLYKEISLAVVNAKDSSSKMATGKKIMNKWIKGKDTSMLKELALDSEEKQIEYVKNMSSGLSGPWFKYFLNYNPSPILRKLKIPVLVLNGNKDVQVLAESNLNGMRTALKESKSEYEVHEVAGANHLFQTCKSCTTQEYSELEQTISPRVLAIITDWLHRKVLSK